VTTTAIEEHQVFLFDLDGTLAAEGKAPAHQCTSLLARLLDSGKHVGIVTARSVREVGDVGSAVASRVSASALRRFSIFTSGGALAYGVAPEQSHPLELVESYVSEDQRAAVQRAGASLSRVPGIRVIDRGPLQTVAVGEPSAMLMVRRLLDRSAEQLRLLMVTPGVMHVLPRTLGKHTAVAHYRRWIGGHPSVAIGDGFYEVPESDVRGNDMDFVGAATLCIQVGRIKPRDPRVLHLPLGLDGPTSTARVVERMYARCTRELESDPILPSAASSVLETQLQTSGLSPAIETFLSKISDYNSTALEPEDAERRALRAANMLREESRPGDAARCLLEGGPLDNSFGRWGGFEGQYDWVLRWLWDEHLARPGVPLTAHVAERARAPLLPEEIAISLIRTLPNIRQGQRVAFVGKDAECALPIMDRLVRACRKHEILPSGTLDPVGIKVSARKSSAQRAIDSAEHLEVGRVARQLWSMLEPRERQSRLPSEVVRRVLDAAQHLPENERRALESNLGECLEQSLSELSLGELVRRMDLQVTSEFSRFVDLGREIVYALHASLLDRPDDSGTPTVESLLASHLPSAGPHADRIAAQYRALTGRATLETPGDLLHMNSVLFDLLGEKYEELGDFEFPLTPVLRELMSETRVRRVLGPGVLFVDASFNSGTTVLFLKALRRIVAPDAEFRYAALGGVVFHRPLQRDLDWSGHAYLPVLLEEGAPQTFHFFYDENDERVSYASLLTALESARLSDNSGASHIDALCARSAGLFARYADLPAAGLDFRDLVRWWLRRDRVWEMRVLCDRLRFRWPYARSVKHQQRAIALFRELDETVAVQERARFALLDRDLAVLETRQLILDWMARRENWLRRAFDFIEQIVDHTQGLREYVADPSPVGWRKLQRVLMTTLRPAMPFE
jgi:hypothetical protein